MASSSSRHIEPLLIVTPPAFVDLQEANIVVEAQVLEPLTGPTELDLTPAGIVVEAQSSVIGTRGDLEATDLVWTFDYAGAQTMAIHQLLALELDDRLDDSETLRFTIPANDPKAGFVLIDALVRYKRRFYRVTARNPNRDGTRAVIDVEAEARWLELAGRTRVGTFTQINATPEGGLTKILDGTIWEPGDVLAGAGDVYGIDATDQSVLALVRAWAAIVDAEVIFDSELLTVSLVEARGQARDRGFRYGYNLRGIIRREEPPSATVLYAYGRNDLVITGINPEAEPFLEDFSYYTGQGLSIDDARAFFTRTQIWKDDSFVSDEPLYYAALARLERLAQPVISYEAKVIDLERAIGEPLTADLGDTVPVYDGVLGFAIRARVVRVVDRPLVPNGREIELAYLQGRPVPPSTSSSRGGTIIEWLLFLADANSARTIGAGLQITNDLGLQFAKGEAIFHLDAVGTATGSGTLRMYVYDEVSDVVIGNVVDVPFTTGVPVHIGQAFSLNELQGNYLFSIRTQVITGSGTVALAAGDVDFSILCKGGLGVTIPPEANSITFVYNGSDGQDGTPQDFDVPPGVTTVVVDCYGAQGQDNGVHGTGGRGGRIRARVDVIGGETLEVRVGGSYGGISGPVDKIGYNGGGSAGLATGGSTPGGGVSDVRRGPSYALTDRLIVAGGGGGVTGGIASGDGGQGGSPTGGAATGGGVLVSANAGGGTQSAGGSKGLAGFLADGAAGALGQGGHGYALSGYPTAAGGGGGGGGLYGGGGGGDSGAGGGGSSGAPDPTATEVLIENGVRAGHGLVVISWDTPV